MQFRPATAALAALLAVAGLDSTAAADKPSPASTARPAAPDKGHSTNIPATAPAARPVPVDINSASTAELMTLPGIGEAQAARIIAGRPYPTKARLASDKILTETEYFAVRGRIVAVQKKQARAKPTKPAASHKG